MWISLIGTWMQSVAQPWLASFHHPLRLFTGFGRSHAISPHVALRAVRRGGGGPSAYQEVDLFTQAASLLIVLLMALLVYSGHILFWHILALATALGFVNTLDMPARQAFVIQLVEKRI